MVSTGCTLQADAPPAAARQPKDLCALLLAAAAAGTLLSMMTATLLTVKTVQAAGEAAAAAPYLPLPAKLGLMALGGVMVALAHGLPPLPPGHLPVMPLTTSPSLSAAQPSAAASSWPCTVEQGAAALPPLDVTMQAWLDLPASGVSQNVAATAAAAAAAAAASRQHPGPPPPLQAQQPQPSPLLQPPVRNGARSRAAAAWPAVNDRRPESVAEPLPQPPVSGGARSQAAAALQQSPPAAQPSVQVDSLPAAATAAAAAEIEEEEEGGEEEEEEEEDIAAEIAAAVAAAAEAAEAAEEEKEAAAAATAAATLLSACSPEDVHAWVLGLIPDRMLRQGLGQSLQHQASMPLASSRVRVMFRKAPGDFHKGETLLGLRRPWLDRRIPALSSSQITRPPAPRRPQQQQSPGAGQQAQLLATHKCQDASHLAGTGAPSHLCIASPAAGSAQASRCSTLCRHR